MCSSVELGQQAVSLINKGVSFIWGPYMERGSAVVYLSGCALTHCPCMVPSSRCLQCVDEYIDAESGNVLVERSAPGHALCLWGNLSKNPRCVCVCACLTVLV